MNNIKRVGVIGGGQLAWMMAGAAKALGVELAIQTPHPSDPAVAFAAFTIFAPVDDSAATAELATRCDAIAFENEFINLEALMPLQEQGVLFRPRLEALAPLLDKYDQRCYLRDLGLPVPKFVALEERGSGGVGERGRGGEYPIPFPAVLKVRRHGYDGQGTFIIKDRKALEATLQRLGHTPVLLEEFIPFERELAVIAARSSAGEMAIYPVVETQQEEQVCRRVLVPAGIDPAVTGQIEAIAHTLLNSLQAVGVFGIELFLTADGKVLVNEIAPRTHNSGHFTLDACYTSQFEQHLRAICDLPLGNPALKCGAAVMVNLLGYEYSHNDYLAKRQQLAQLPNSHVHWYGKSESRPGRKLGHVTVLLDGATKSEAQVVAQTLESIWYSSRSVR
ncbi:5-(carboxyamino)imidazole ribonucleotide synthase [Argonema galeatum]|uniref:5-(carboxyamino)imidazole ribonucleotide synthase n=1 Tax=Argonema galeatum TaxID=2942762 RepID=UPI002012C6B6|nr:5-(carboxyamino)imidazole ribonucleotide synthase [Argonema galeatum]MCL1468100.1 5-(carboxyamino)imidazole ribonucleotide synthase [Argonema galeatum A003/A1]